MISDPPSLSPSRPKVIQAAAVVLPITFVASVSLGPQLALWPSGPALLLLSVASFLVLRSPACLPRPVFWSGLALVAWLVCRIVASPVLEFAVADGLLLASGIAVFFIARAVLAVRGGIEVLFTGLGLLVVANWYPMWMQAKDSSYVLWLPRGTEGYPSGFFGYYGDCAAFLTGMALLSGGVAWDSRRRPWFRIFMVLAALAAVAGVAFTRARGGILGLGAGGLVLLALAPWVTLSRGSSWRGVLALILPLALICGIWGIGHGLSEAQRVRGLGLEGTADLLDSPIRLFWLKLAASCMMLHPWQGGGSRSFSWENLRFWDRDWSKLSNAEPEFVHNEWMQLTCDYGIIGLLLLVTFLGAVVVAGIVGRWDGREAKAGSALLLAGISALAGLLVHACFHFVVHLPPMALLLGLILATILGTKRPAEPATVGGTGRNLPSALLMAGCAVVLGGFGMLAIRTFLELAPLRYRFGQTVPPPAEAIERIGRAAKIWPGHALPLMQGRLLKEYAMDASGVDRTLMLESSATAFREAQRLHPFDPGLSVNLANILSTLGHDEEAEREFDRAIVLQGGAERSFQARFWASNHHWRQTERLRAAGDTARALANLVKARDLCDVGASDTFWEYGTQGRTYRLALSQHLGTWLEGLHRHEEAAAEYDRAAKILGSEGIHFLAARNLAAWGDAVWLERRPESAMRLFTDARSRLKRAAGISPPGYKREDLNELGQRLEGKITFLQGAGITPAD